MRTIGYEQYDAWLIHPPCETRQGCREGCPYYAECWPDEQHADEDEDEDD